MTEARMIRLNAGHTTNGNPRRVFVLISDTGLDAWDEGYDGTAAVPDALRSAAATAPTFATTPKEYRALLKEYGR